MPLSQLIYVSRPLGYDPQQLDRILTVSRERNAAAGITGLLISRWDLFLQLVEGPRAAIEDTFARIGRDRRHVGIALRHLGAAPARLFPGWEMRSDPSPSWLWPHDAILAGAHLAAPVDELQAIFGRIAARLPSPG